MPRVGNEGVYQSTEDKELDSQMPMLTEYGIAVCIETCNKAGAKAAAKALSNHITRLQIEIDRLRGKK